MKIYRKCTWKILCPWVQHDRHSDDFHETRGCSTRYEKKERLWHWTRTITAAANFFVYSLKMQVFWT